LNSSEKRSLQFSENGVASYQKGAYGQKLRSALPAVDWKGGWDLLKEVHGPCFKEENQSNKEIATEIPGEKEGLSREEVEFHGGGCKARL